MTKYREILRLHSQGVSQRGIASSCRCSRNTVSKVLERGDIGTGEGDIGTGLLSHHILCIMPLLIPVNLSICRIDSP